MSKDMPYTPHTDSILQRLANLQPRTLSVMHGSSFHGDGSTAIHELAAIIKDLLSEPESSSRSVAR